MPTVVHFEIPAENIPRAQKFYGELFGWQIQKYTGPFSMDYWMITTATEKGEKGVDGGLMERQHPEQRITVYIDVPSIDEYIAKVEKLGGQVVFPKTAVPGVGYCAVCLDTENNDFALWENNPNAQ
jgi:predicted enzyme related to lactoylglutathione lyase